jgi:hypothetical protein
LDFYTLADVDAKGMKDRLFSSLIMPAYNFNFLAADYIIFKISQRSETAMAAASRKLPPPRDK